MALTIVLVVGAAFAAFVGFAVTTKSPGALNLLRRINKVTFNRFVSRTAGQEGATYSMIRHVGRRSGNRYETPIEVIRDGDEFAIASVYGDLTDWRRNVLAAGGATIVHEGVEHVVAEPRLVPVLEAVPPLTDEQAARVQRMGMSEVLRLTASG
ncbi:MAG: nitroreductase family deazaflavin-dependent oxidoreductase [Actinomycetota bacterium]